MLPHKPRTGGLQNSVIWIKSSSCIQELCKHKRCSASPQDTSALSLAVWQWEQSSEAGSGRPSPSSCLTQPRVVWMLLYGFLHCAVGQGRLCPVQIQLCASCTHTWSMCSFLGLSGIKDTTRPGVETRDRGHLQETDGINAFLSFL